MSKPSYKILVFRSNEPTITAFRLQDCVEAFESLGSVVNTIKLPKDWLYSYGWAKNSIKDIIEFHPDFVFTVDHFGLSPPLLYILKKKEIPYFSWFGGDPFFWISKERLSNSVSPLCVIFLVERYFSKRLKDFGFEHVFSLQGATNPGIFRKISLTPQEKERYCCDVSFAGSSGYHHYQRFLKAINEIIKISRQPTLLKKIFNEIIKMQMVNSLIDISEIIKDIQNNFQCYFHFEEEIIKGLEWIATTRYRKEIVEAMDGLKFLLYDGDEGWGKLSKKVTPLGWIDNRTELPKLYNATKINLNITRSHSKTAVPVRVFDIAACGGFVLSDFRPDLKNMFDIEKEVICYRDKQHLLELCRYFLDHADERVAIAQRARERVLREHTYKDRMRKVFSVMKGMIGK